MRVVLGVKAALPPESVLSVLLLRYCPSCVATLTYHATRLNVAAVEDFRTRHAQPVACS